MIADVKNVKDVKDVKDVITKTLVLYVFSEYNNRVEQFFKRAIFYDKNIDFIVVINDIKLELQTNTFLPNVTFFNRDNIGFDFGGWSDALLTNNLYKNYKYFIFANSSIIGPFNNSNNNWTDIYINGLEKNNIKLFGSTINCMGLPETGSHVQSYIFSMDIITVEYLIKCEIFTMNNYTTSKQDTIDSREIAMSRKIIKNGWNIGSLMTYYKNVDFTFKTKKPTDYNIVFFDDIMYDYWYKHGLWNLNELIFIKGNRDIII
jgi:hypothetical protein